MRKILLVCMAVFIIAISGCENASFFSGSNKRRPNYNIEYYLDTIYGNVLISTICHNNSDFQKIQHRTIQIRTMILITIWIQFVEM